MANRYFVTLCSLFATLILFFATTSPIFAARGCCSWHGGVSGCDSSTGRYVCNDGTYSPSCTCEVASSPPTATPTQAELQITARVTYNLNSKSNAYTVTIDCDDVYGSDGYSLATSNIAGANSGPLVDTPSSKCSITNVKPGSWYINLQARLS